MDKKITPFKKYTLALTLTLPLCSQLGWSAPSSRAPIKTNRLTTAPAANRAPAMTAGAAPLARPPVWEVLIPPKLNKPELWQGLLAELEQRELPFHAYLAAQQMQVLFTDVASKELALKTLVNLADLGLNIPFRTHFLTSDLEPNPSDLDFYLTYYLYKGILNQEKGIQHWAKNHFGKLENQAFPKFLFYQAVEAYRGKRIAEAKDLLRQILALKSDLKGLSLTAKTARTLARIYFEEKEYKKSQDIYENYLLKINPMRPSDWLESAWNDYYLEKYSEAMGKLYNLESQAAGDRQPIEKFFLRALIYKSLCQTPAMQTLAEWFEGEFSDTVIQLKRGGTLTNLPLLQKIAPEEGTEYGRLLALQKELSQEESRVDGLSSDYRELIRYLDQTKQSLFQAALKREEDAYLKASSKKIVLLSEQLKFMNFEVEQSKHDPDKVFQNPLASQSARTPASAASKDKETTDKILWPQMGDFWRPERLTYRGAIQSLCSTQQKP